MDQESWSGTGEERTGTKVDQEWEIKERLSCFQYLTKNTIKNMFYMNIQYTHTYVCV